MTRHYRAKPEAGRCTADRKPLKDGSGARCMLPRLPGSQLCAVHTRQAMLAARRVPGPTKRGYSKEFRAVGETGKRYTLVDIPAGLWADARLYCKRHGLSVRAFILTLITDALKEQN